MNVKLKTNDNDKSSFYPFANLKPAVVYCSDDVLTYFLEQCKQNITEIVGINDDLIPLIRKPFLKTDDFWKIEVEPPVWKRNGPLVNYHILIAKAPFTKEAGNSNGGYARINLNGISDLGKKKTLTAHEIGHLLLNAPDCEDSDCYMERCRRPNHDIPLTDPEKWLSQKEGYCVDCQESGKQRFWFPVNRALDCIKNTTLIQKENGITVKELGSLLRDVKDTGFSNDNGYPLNEIKLKLNW